MSVTTHRLLGAPLIVMWALIATHALGATWGPETRVTSAVGHSWAPRLAAWNGAVHAVWFDYPNAGADADIFYARSADNGNTWSAPVNLSSDPTRLAVSPAIVVDASGVYVTWSSDVLSGELYLRRSLDNGATWHSTQQLTSGTGYSRAGDIAVDGSGVLHVVYYDDRLGYSNIYHRQSCDHGFSWSPEQNVTAHDGVVDNEAPRLTQGGDGKLYLTYRSSRDGLPQGGWPPYEIYLLRATGVGCPANPLWLYPAQRVSRGLPDEFSDTYGPQIAAGGGARIHIAYWDQLAGNDVAHRRLVPDGAGFGPINRMAALGPNHRQAESTNAEAGNLGIAEDNAATLHLLFTENVQKTASVSYGRLFYRSSADAGAVFAPLEQVGTTTMAAMPKFAYARGRVHAVWTDFRDNFTGGEIYARYRDLGQVDLITHFYLSILNRPPDAGGKASWDAELARVQALGLDACEVLLVMSGYFFNSLEYQLRNRNNTQYVSDLYVTYFNRAADSGGQGFWVAQLDAGAPRDMVRYAFALSSEHDAFTRFLWGATASRAEDTMVSDFYRAILDRLGESGTYNYWRGRFRAAQCVSGTQVRAEADTITAAFFGSAEYAQRGRDNVGFMQDLYLALMRRYATLFELWSWTNALNNGEYTREQVRQIFLSSYEFQLRTDRVMQQGCLF